MTLSTEDVFWLQSNNMLQNPAFNENVSAQILGNRIAKVRYYAPTQSLNNFINLI